MQKLSYVLIIFALLGLLLASASLSAEEGVAHTPEVLVRIQEEKIVITLSNNQTEQRAYLIRVQEARGEVSNRRGDSKEVNGHITNERMSTLDKHPVLGAGVSVTTKIPLAMLTDASLEIVIYHTASQEDTKFELHTVIWSGLINKKNIKD